MELFNKQLEAFKLITLGKNVFLSGVAGTGKSKVLQEAIKELRSRGKRVVVCAYTRKAALNLDDEGLTIFKAFNTYPNGMKFDNEGLFRLYQSPAAHADVIIVDEISMCPKSMFSYICLAIRRISFKNGCREIPLTASGDFSQLPPIAKRGEVPQYAFESPLWDKCSFQNVFLEQSWRQTDPSFIECLKEIRKGKNIAKNVEYLKDHAHYMEEKPDAIYIYSYKDDVMRKNNEIIDSIPGEPIFYFARSDSKAALEESGFWDVVKLKKGARVIITRNDKNDEDIYNGQLGQIVDMNEDEVTVRIKSVKSGELKDVIIGYNAWANGDGERVEQLPIIPAYAVTVHKAQGLTLDYVNVDPKCFAEGQFYVAISRVRDVSHLYITGELNEKDIKVSGKVLRFYERMEMEHDSNTENDVFEAS